MSRPLLKLKPPAPAVPELPPLPDLPPRPPKREGLLNQLLTFIVVDRKPYHHATYDEAAMERAYLQAAAERAPRKGKWRQDFRVMKVVNITGAHAPGVVILPDKNSTLEEEALDNVREVIAEIRVRQGNAGSSDMQLAEAAIRAYVGTLRAAQP
jgi:hypothetical protein